MMNNSIALLCAWNLQKYDNHFYTLNVHYSYVKYASESFRTVYLITSVKVVESMDGVSIDYCIDDFKNVEVVELPPVESYAKSIVNFKRYKEAILSIKDKVDLFYSRVPDPFAWMPALMTDKKSIMHFVGDTIDATHHNENWSWLKKKIMIAGYLPEYALTLKAARRSRVFTNGHHLAVKLEQRGVKATAVVSSTVSEKDLHEGFVSLPIQDGMVEITYVGFVRFAKGMNCLMDFCHRLRDAGINYHFNLIGSGEMMDDVKAFVEKEQLNDLVTLHGHIDSKQRMNEILRHSDLFFFPSLSEGSPRVVIEAMAQGTPVMSTPVGSLPTAFEDGKSIRFFGFNDAEKAVSIVREFLNDAEPFEHQRQTAYSMVKESFTLEKFLSKVFCYEA